MTLKWNEDGVQISHESQIGAFLTKQGMGECKGLSTLMEGYASADSYPDNTATADI
jgi:hypothetical protein